MGELRPHLTGVAFFLVFSATTARLMVFAAALVASQPLFDADRGLFGAVIGIGGHAFGFEQCTRIEMQNAFGPEAKSIFSNGRMAGIASPEIFRSGFLDPIGDLSLQRGTDADVSSGNA